MTSTELRVAISGFGGLDNPEAGTGTARALRLGWRGRLAIDALGYDPWINGAWEPGLADRLCLMPPVVKGDLAVLHRVLELHAEHPIDVLMPCLDLEVPIYARLARRLRRHGIRTLLPEAEDVYPTQKIALPLFCYQNGIAAPLTVHVPSVSDVALHADQLGYPLMVKGTVAGAVRVENREQAGVEAASLNARWGNGVLLQQAIEGDEYVVGVVARGDGTSLGHVAVRKLGVNRLGKGVVGAVVDDPELERESMRILGRMHWRGPLELEFIRARNTGQLILLEINCRMPAWILLSHWAGCNLPVLLVREMLEPGRRRRRAAARTGTAFVRDVRDAAIPIDRFERLRRFGSVLSDGAPARRGARRRSGDGWRVAVTGISALDTVLPGLGVARALRAAPEVGRVYGLSYGPYDSGLYRSELFDL